tara:strand:- start:136 stop:372 length:237 start_codon:yes stop_codon:yes gene_type:complete
MTDNDTFYDDFDWDADTEEMEPREFRLAYKQADNEFPDPELLKQDNSFFPQMGLKPEPITEKTSSCCRTTVPNKEFHS